MSTPDFSIPYFSTMNLSTPDFSTMNFSTPDFSNMTFSMVNLWARGLKSLQLKSLVFKSSWLKSPGLKCPSTKDFTVNRNETYLFQLQRKFVWCDSCYQNAHCKPQHPKMARQLFVIHLLQHQICWSSEKEAVIFFGICSSHSILLVKNSLEQILATYL